MLHLWIGVGCPPSGLRMEGASSKKMQGVGADPNSRGKLFVLVYSVRVGQLALC